MGLIVAGYLVAMIAANLLVAAFGPWISPINSFFLIGYDLTARDYLHTRLKPAQLAGLVAASGLLTWLLSPAASHIAIASASAFTLGALADWSVFARLKGSWLKRATGSNVAGAAVDSIVFPTMAFGVLMPGVVLAQFAAKVVGGALWALLFARLR